MQDRIGAGGDAFDVNLARCGMEQGKQFGCSILGVFVWLLGWLSFWFPMVPRIGDGLVWSGFILRPDGQSLLLSYGVRLLDEFFLAQASGSLTSTVPLLRTRMAVPVSHQVRSSCHVYPASCKTHKIV